MSRLKQERNPCRLPSHISLLAQRFQNSTRRTGAPWNNGEAFKKTLPAYNESWFDVAAGSAAEIDLAVQAAEKAASGPWSRTTPGDRAKMLHRIGDLIEANVETLALAESVDTGKPYSETRNGDIPRSAQNFHFFADLAAHQNF